MSNDETPGPERPEKPETSRTPEQPEAAGMQEPAEGVPPRTPAADAESRAAAAGRPDRPERGEPGDRSDRDEPGPVWEKPEPAAPRRAAAEPAGAELPPESPIPEPLEAAEDTTPPESAGASGGGVSGRTRLLAVLWPPRVTRAQLIVALLLFVLGLGLAIQVRSTSDNSALRGARQEDLVRILDELDDRTERLEGEKRRLEDQRTELESSSDQAEEARKQTVEKEQQLGVLAGTVAAQGPGINVTIRDARGTVQADMLLDAIQELRAAGAEAIQINNVRIVADSSFADTTRGVRIGDRTVRAPFRFKVIGKPQDLEPALNIPGGVVQSLEKEQAEVVIAPSKRVVVDALRPVKRPDYARSSSQ